MNFCEQLNDYIKQIGCSSQELVTASGLTTSVISRYRRGDRNPNIRSKQLEQLVDGLYKLSNLFLAFLCFSVNWDSGSSNILDVAKCINSCKKIVSKLEDLNPLLLTWYLDTTILFVPVS